MPGSEEAFNKAASAYDQLFTESKVGRLQRGRVWNYIQSNVSSAEYPRVLELNCGTGTDALWLASKGFRVTATDISEEMIKIASAKNERSIHKASFEVCGFDQITNHFIPASYDLIFSDFGGLNCVDEPQLRLLAEQLSLLLRPGGRFIAVVMSDDCMLEKWYFRKKGEAEKALRRKTSGGTPTSIEGVEFKTWYYSPEIFTRIVSNVFTVNKIKAVGWTIPPSYTEKYFSTKPILLKTLSVIENTLGNIESLARKADHFLIDLTRK